MLGLLFATGIVLAGYVGTHLFLAIRLKVPLPPFRARAPAESFSFPRRRRVAVRLGALAGAYLVVVVLGVPMIRTREFDTRVKVLPGSGAERAGIRDGDRVLALGDEPVRTFEELQAATARAHSPVSLTIERGGKPLSVAVTLDAQRHLGLTPRGDLLARRWPLLFAEALAFPARVAFGTVRLVSRAAEGQLPADRVLLRPREAMATLGMSRAELIAWAVASTAASAWLALAIWVALSTGLLEWRGSRREG